MLLLDQIRCKLYPQPSQRARTLMSAAAGCVDSTWTSPDGSLKQATSIHLCVWAITGASIYAHSLVIQRSFVSEKYEAKGMSLELEMAVKSENDVTNGHTRLLINQVNFRRATRTRKPWQAHPARASLMLTPILVLMLCPLLPKSWPHTILLGCTNW